MKAGKDKWQAKKINGDFFVIRHGSYTRQHGYTSYQPIAEIDCKSVRDFVAKANPATVLELLDERERNQQYIKSRDQENEDIALTVGKLLIENGRLVADTLRHLADNEIDSDYFAITSTNENGTEIDHEVAITDYALQAAGTVDELVAALEAAEKRIAELEAREILLPERSSMLHRTDFHDDYQTVMAYKVSEVIDAILATGIRIKGE
ncbi:ead/Ea22-like family protein [Escherichia coli]